VGFQGAIKLSCQKTNRLNYSKKKINKGEGSGGEKKAWGPDEEVLVPATLIEERADRS